jgi:hypothetical protein
MGPGANNTNPWELGIQWLTGTGPRNQFFGPNDELTQLYREHDHVQDVIGFFDTWTRNGEYEIGHSYKYDYALSGFDGVWKYLKDYSTLLTLGSTGNLAYTYMGSHTVRMTPIRENADGSVVWRYTAHNESDIESATHPPVVGYTEWWSDNIGAPLNDWVGSSGPMSPTRQTIDFTVTLGP